MIFNYKAIAKHNPQDVTAPKRYYAMAAHRKEVTIDTLVKEISHASSINASDVMAVIESFIEFIPQHLIDGKLIQLSKFGSFRLNLNSKGEDSPEEVNAHTILRVRTVFQPTRQMSHQLANIKYVKVKGDD